LSQQLFYDYNCNTAAIFVYINIPMQNNTALVFYYTHINKFSFNALLGALEIDPSFDNLPLYLIETEKELFDKAENIINKHNKIIFCFSFFTVQAPEIQAILQKLKAYRSDKFTFIAGGPHATGLPEETLNLGFDIAVIGEGEETLPVLLKALEQNKDYADIKGLSYKDASGTYCNSGKAHIIDLNKYPAQAEKNKIFGSIEITRGCPFFCKFCQTPHMFGGKQRHRSLENILHYLTVMKAHKLRDIRFITPSAFSYGSADGRHVNLQALEKLFSSIKRTLGSENRIFIGTFPSEVRPEQVTKETLRLVKDYASNDNIIIGAQSGSQRMLKHCNRGHTVKDILNAVELTRKADLGANVDFIFGLPGETDDDRLQTEKVIKIITKMGGVIRPHTFMKLPQTPFYL